MKRCRYQRGSRSLLAAVVLVGSWMPPAYEHAHADGHTHHHHHGLAAGHDDEHDHGQDHLSTEPARLSKMEEHGASAGEERAPGQMLAAAPEAHVHWSFLMFQLTWPAGDEEGGSPPVGLADGEELWWVASDCKLQADALRSGNLPATLGDLQSALLQVIGKPPDDSCRPPPLPCHRTLLCDTARHERSGVQLI